MKTIPFILLTALLTVPSAFWARAADATPSTAPKIRIVLVGDSTVNDGGGWGYGFKRFLNTNAECINTAANGRSSKSFITEGRWDKALALRGDYYLIQFGHNDEPGKGPERETDPATTYTQNLARYVDEARAIGARPVLVTSLTRRNFDESGDGKIVSTLTPYVEAVRRLAAAEHVPLVDLNAISTAYCERIGPDKTAEFNAVKKDGKPDTTHLNRKGQLVFAREVVAALRQAVPALAPYLLSEPNPAAVAPRSFNAKKIGATGEFLPGKDGLVHISELANFRVKKTEDIVKVGDDITVKCLGVDEKGRVRLSRKAALEDRDKEEAAAAPAPAPAA